MRSEYRDPNVLLNEIRMESQLFQGIAVVVEDDASYNVFSNFFNSALCRFYVSAGRPNAITILSSLEATNFLRVIAIVDSDFDRLLGPSYVSERYFTTDGHDIEAMVIISDAFVKFKKVHMSKEKVKKNDDPKALLLRAAIVIGHLRLLSLKNDWKFSFKEFKYAKFIDKKTLSLDVLKFVTYMSSKNSGEFTSLGLSREQMLDMLSMLPTDDENILIDLCCGDDLVGILCLGMTHLFASWKLSDARRDAVSADLLLAYEEKHFKQTRLHAKVDEYVKECFGPSYLL